jgi:hypothetical protein
MNNGKTAEQIIDEVRERVGGYLRVSWHDALTGYDVALAGERDPEVIAARIVRVYPEGDTSFVTLHLRSISNVTIPCGSEKQAEYIAEGIRRDLVIILEAFAKNT